LQEALQLGFARSFATWKSSSGGSIMRKLFLLFSVLLLGLSWAVAQSTTGSQDQNGSASASQSGGYSGQSSSPTGAGGQMTVEGCLSGSSGNYTLTDKNGTAYQLTGDTAKLSEHVGHEIKVTGTSASAGASASGSTETSAAGSAGAGQALQVTSVKHISKSCKTGGSGMSH
jgi:Protein of unknown function (DUF5818)